MTVPKLLVTVGVGGGVIVWLAVEVSVRPADGVTVATFVSEGVGTIVFDLVDVSVGVCECSRDCVGVA